MQLNIILQAIAKNTRKSYEGLCADLRKKRALAHARFTTFKAHGHSFTLWVIGDRAELKCADPQALASMKAELGL